MSAQRVDLRSVFLARLQRPSQPRLLGWPILGVSLIALAVAGWMANANQPDTDELGPYGADLLPVFIGVAAASGIVSAIAEVLPEHAHRAIVGLRVCSILIRAASFAIWGIVLWGIIFGER